MQQIQTKGQSPHTWLSLSVGVKVMKKEGKDRRGQMRQECLGNSWFGGTEDPLVQLLNTLSHLVSLPGGAHRA